MHVKFLAHGTGSGARASAYLLGAHDHTGAERAGVTVLRGAPARVAAAEEAPAGQQRQPSAAVSWAAEEAPAPAESALALNAASRPMKLSVRPYRSFHKAKATDPATIDPLSI